MVSLSVAEGGKPRLGGWLLPATFAPIVGASTRALLLKLPVRSPAMSGFYFSPRSSALFLSFDGFNWRRNQCSASLAEEPITTPHYRGSVKMLTVSFAAGIKGCSLRPLWHSMSEFLIMNKPKIIAYLKP